MIFKKKYHGGLLAFCLLCSVFFFGNISSSYATQPSLQEMTDFIDLIKVKQESGEIINRYKINGDSSSIASDFLSITSDVDFSLQNVVYFSIGQIKYNTGSWANNTNPTQGAFIIANGGMGNDSLDNIYITVNNNGSAGFNVVFKSSSPSRPTFYYINGSHCYKLTLANTFYSEATNLQYSLNSTQSVVTNNLIFTKYKTFAIYSSFNYGSSYIPVLNNFNGITFDEYYIPPEPPEPENTTGNITNSSGDTTGKIDLSGIENGITGIVNQISGDTHNIIDNQNQNTQEIVNALSGETQKIIENSNQNLDNVFEFDEDESSSFEEYYEIVSGDFRNPYDIDSINQDFLNSFDSSMEEDFIISWNGVNFSVLGSDEVPLIPSGEINFSALCRENETIGSVKHYLSLFCVCSLGVFMLKEFYNMLLATLGIGSYFYANTDEEELHTSVYYDMDTGRTTTTYYGHAEDGSNVNVSYNHSRVKPHRRIGFK